MGIIERVTSLAIATILDPRFKKMHFTVPIACSSAVAKVKEFMKATIQNEVVESDSSDHSDKPEDNFSLWDDHHKLVHKSWKTAKSDDAISDELSIYLRSPVRRLNKNPLEIWNDLKIQLPKLHTIAYKYLTMVGTSVLSERLFSKAAQIVNQQRNRLKGKNNPDILTLLIAAILAFAAADPAPAPKPQVILTSAGIPIATTADIAIPAAASWTGAIAAPGVDVAWERQENVKAEPLTAEEVKRFKTNKTQGPNRIPADVVVKTKLVENSKADIAVYTSEKKLRDKSSRGSYNIS
ncbi:hypothetical protein ILUMI_22952 [Ignelater luminosus]|uniref:HAT C-terminal dimerisation domain-containing protein n=1 Tax=Ignelater luminosus TaxID=2038154 RepID=A0A8K0CG55_IGNLU|nr:hypothetical protein ILUMI_22952 [Ignelater luminosus]